MASLVKGPIKSNKVRPVDSMAKRPSSGVDLITLARLMIESVFVRQMGITKKEVASLYWQIFTTTGISARN